MAKQKHSDIDHLLDEDGNVPSPFFSYGPAERESPRQPVESQVDSEGAELHEVKEHEPSEEVEKHIEPRQEMIKLDKELKDAGAHAQHDTSFPSYDKIKLPISDEKIIAGKKAPITSSIRWLSELCLYLLHKAHIRLKVAHGKTQRLFRK